ASVTEQGTHRVHLRVADRAVAARSVDLFQNDAGFRNAESRASILFGDQSGEITAASERIDKFLWILFVLVNVFPIRVWKILTEPAHLFTNRVPRILY